MLWQVKMLPSGVLNGKTVVWPFFCKTCLFFFFSWSLCSRCSKQQTALKMYVIFQFVSLTLPFVAICTLATPLDAKKTNRSMLKEWCSNYLHFLLAYTSFPANFWGLILPVFPNPGCFPWLGVSYSWSGKCTKTPFVFGTVQIYVLKDKFSDLPIER